MPAPEPPPPASGKIIHLCIKPPLHILHQPNPQGKRLLLLLLLTGLFATAGTPDTWHKYELTGPAQGTRYLIRYYTTGPAVPPSSIDSLLRLMDHCFSLYQEHSVLRQFNNQPRGMPVPPAFQHLLKHCFEVFEQTRGLADPTVLPLVRYWTSASTPQYSRREKATLRSLRSCVGLQGIQFIGDSLVKQQPCLQLDLNGIAQGYTVDMLADFLEQRHVHNYVVELGGEVRVKGTRQPGGEKFRIALERPAEQRSQPGETTGYLYLDQGALTTSGHYRKYYESGGQQQSHIINPLTGYPVDNELISVTVYAKTAVVADAYDNAILAMGLQKGLEFVESHPFLAAHFIYRNASGILSDTSSTGLQHLWLP